MMCNILKNSLEKIKGVQKIILFDLLINVVEKEQELSWSSLFLNLNVHNIDTA